MTVRWKGINSITKKEVRQPPPFDGNEAYEGVSPINIAGLTSFTITGLEDNSTYHFALTAYSGADESDFSDIITVFPGDDQSVMWYWDNDWDGYGTPTISVESASQPSGYVIDNSDCEDNNGNIHPGAIEICGDNIDQDCNGSDTVCEPDPR